MVMCTRIPLFRDRLRAIYLLSRFIEETNQLVDSISFLSQSHQEVLDSVQLKLFLGIILSVGNYMNGDVEKTDAICINSFGILSSTKSKENSFTLLDFVVYFYENVLSHDRSEIMEELKHFSRACNEWTIGELKSNVRKLLKEIESISAVLKA
jgi:hypothetical protein